MEIKIKTSYELGQEVNEKGIKGKVIRIEIIVYSEDKQDVDYVLDNGVKIRLGYKNPKTKKI